MAKFCKYCGTQLEDSAVFCIQCGQKVGGPVAQPQQAPAQPQQAPAQPKQTTAQPRQAAPQAAPSAKQPKAPKAKKAKTPKGESCGNCGGSIRPGNDYCTTCGAPRGAVPKNRRVVIDKQGRVSLKKKRHPKRAVAILLVLALVITGFIQPGWILNLTMRPKTIPGAEKIEVEVTANGQVVEKGKATGGIGLPTTVSYSADEVAKAPAQTVQVSPENPVAYLDNGVIVDFGNNLALLADEEDENGEVREGPSTLTVRTLPAKEDDDNGCTVTGMDFDLDGVTEFPLPVAITVPYSADQDPYALVPQHYDEALGRYAYTAYDIDEASRTLTYYVHHFSGSLMSDYTQSKYLDLTDSEGPPEGNPLNKITVQLLPSKMEQIMATKKGAEAYVNAMLGKSQQSTLDWIMEGSDTAGNVSGGGDIVISLKDLVLSNGNLLNGIDVGFNVIGITFSGLKMYQDFLKTESLDETLSRNKKEIMGVAISSAGIANAAAGFVTGAALFPGAGLVILGASAAMFAFNYLDSKVTEVNYNGNGSYMGNAYNEFTENKLVFSPKYRRLDWELTQTDFDNAVRYAGSNYSKLETKLTDRLYGGYRLRTGEGQQGAYVSIMNRIKADHPDDPSKWVPIFENYVHTIANFFFDGLSDETRTMLSRIYNRGNSDWWNTDAEIRNLRTEMEKKLLRELNTNGTFYKDFMHDSYVAMKEQAYAALGRQQDYMNQVIYFDLELKNSKGETISFREDPAFRNKFIVLDTSGAKDKLKGTDPWAVAMDSDNLFHCTLNSYLLAGEPTQLLVYNSYRDYALGKAAAKVIPIPKVTAEVLNSARQANSSVDEDRLGTPKIDWDRLSSQGTVSPADILPAPSGKSGAKTLAASSTVTTSRHNGAATVVISITNEIPTLEEVAGFYENATLTVTEVQTSAALQAVLNEYGCDLNELQGKSVKLPFTISQVGENQAVLAAVPSEDQDDFAFTNDPMTYDEIKGILKAVIAAEEQSIDFRFECTYTDAQKSGVQVSGSFQVRDSDIDGLTLTYRLSGIKSLVDSGGGDDYDMDNL